MSDYEFMHLHKEASFLFGYECTKPYKRKFAFRLLNVIELNQDYILRRLQIVNSDINKWYDKQVDNYIEVATKSFDASGLPISDEMDCFLYGMNELIDNEAKDEE